MAEPAGTQSDRRPLAKEYLKLAEQETRGKLKVFLGMAPGVGKTFAMLAAAKALKADGIDAVVGVVETHGRAETAALLDGLEVLPRIPVEYRQRTLMEFDVEAAIGRRPKLLLIDEFAHSNAPGMLHAKRYQDAEEILRNGIDVWTTLNIQHLESLQDVVQRITGVRVQETVPDKVLERADEIVVVDLTPEELIQRLKDGKVYLPENARRAIDQFFKPSNLTALRELALRRTADRVDVQMLAQLRQQGIEGPWPTAERMLVCVGNGDLSDTLVRTAGRMATAQKADWIALNLRPPTAEAGGRSKSRRIEKLMRLAERLGATTVRLNAKDLSGEILAYAKRNNITQIVIGRSKANFVDRLLGRSLSQDLVTRARGLAVLVVAPDQEPKRRWIPDIPPLGVMTSALISSSLTVAVATLLGFFLEWLTPLPNLSLVFLPAVLLCAMRFGLHAALCASILSFLAYNYFFIEPRYSFTVATPQELLSLFIFLIVSFVTGTLAARLRDQAYATHDRAEATEALFDFSRKLTGCADAESVLWLLASQAAAIVKGKSIVLLDEGNGLEIKGGWPPDDQLGTPDWAAARWALQKRELAGRGTGTLPSARYQFRPLQNGTKTAGVLGVDFSGDADVMSSAAEQTLQSFVEQAGIALERTTLVKQAAKAEAAAEGERLRAALLSSVSHDLRTPLASIVGSVTSLRSLGERMPQSDRDDLLATIEEEAARLSRFVSNLLDMTRIEAGAIDIRRDWVDVGDVIRGTVARAAKSFPDRKTEIVIASGLPLVRSDAALLEQVIFNLLENAHKYSGPRSVTKVQAKSSNGGVAISVSDQGPGIPPDALPRIFEKFYRVSGVDGRAPGTGLGLSICEGLVKAMNGTIAAESPIEGAAGTRLTITLPAGEPNGISVTEPMTATVVTAAEQNVPTQGSTA